MHSSVSNVSNLPVLWSGFKDEAHPAGFIALFLPPVLLPKITPGVHQVAASSAHTVHGTVLSVTQMLVICSKMNVLFHVGASTDE